MGEGGWEQTAAYGAAAGGHHGDPGERGLSHRLGLSAKAVGKLVRTVRRVQAAGGATGTVVTDRRRAAARRVGKSPASCAAGASCPGRKAPR